MKTFYGAQHVKIIRKNSAHKIHEFTVKINEGLIEFYVAEFLFPAVE